MYTDRPVLIKELFDKSVHKEICEAIDTILPVIRKDEDAIFNRVYAHNVPYFNQIHSQLTDYASALFGERVKPSYSFVSLYNDKGRCPLHIDRPQCRYTIDYLVRQDSKDPWPIRIGPPMSNVEVQKLTNGTGMKKQTEKEEDSIIKSVNWFTNLLKPNDAVCYSGSHCWHYRPEPSKGKADLVFFHFVPENFNGPLD